MKITSRDRLMTVQIGMQTKAYISLFLHRLKAVLCCCWCLLLCTSVAVEAEDLTYHVCLRWRGRGLDMGFKDFIGSVGKAETGKLSKSAGLDRTVWRLFTTFRVSEEDHARPLASMVHLSRRQHRNAVLHCIEQMHPCDLRLMFEHIDV